MVTAIEKWPIHIPRTPPSLALWGTEEKWPEQSLNSLIKGGVLRWVPSGFPTLLPHLTPGLHAHLPRSSEDTPRRCQHLSNTSTPGATHPQNPLPQTRCLLGARGLGTQDRVHPQRYRAPTSLIRSPLSPDATGWSPLLMHTLDHSRPVSFPPSPRTLSERKQLKRFW